MDPTDKNRCQREEETKPARSAEIRQMLEDYADDVRAIIKDLRRKLFRLNAAAKQKGPHR